MKRFDLKKKAKVLLTGLAILGQVIASAVMPLVANAGIMFPEQVTVEYDSNSLYVAKGTNSDGSDFDERIPPLYAVYEGARQPIFCLQPGVPIINEVTPGYTANPLPEFANNPRTKYLSVLWKYAGNDIDTQQVAQLMIWEYTDGKTINYLRRPDGSMVDVEGTKARINQVIEDYQKKPSFDGQKVTVKLGESITLTDTNNSNLESFDNIVQNSANVDVSIKGNQVIITPKKDSNINGTLRIVKSRDVGTPVAYSLEGSQMTMAGAVDDPNGYQIPLDIIKTGDVKVTKLDEGTGEPVPNTEFDATFEGKTQKVITDKNGVGIIKDIYDKTKVAMTETFVPAPYVRAKNNTKTIIVEAGKVTPVEFRNERATGKSTLSKIDKTTESTKPLNPNYPMTGAKYGWFKVNEAGEDTILQEFTLDDKQTATVENQPLGNYYWKETVAPVGYALDPTKHEVALTYKDQETPVVVGDAKSADDVLRMNMDLLKLIQNETNELFKNGVEFTATNSRTGEKFVETTATVDGKKGYLQFKDLPLDGYVITETKGVKGYKDADPMEVTVSYNKKDNSFTFTVTDQKSGNVLNEETYTQEELSKGPNIELGSYTIKDKATPTEEPKVGISTQAHTGDGKTQTFTWGEEAKFYDDTNLTHENIPVGTKRAYETKLHANYSDGSTAVVWTSGIKNYTVSDKEMTERVIAEYDYRKDPKADEKTTYFFSEDGYNYDGEKPKKDTEHNPDGKDPKQQLTPVAKETPKTKATPSTPTRTGTLPSTGETIQSAFMLIGFAIAAAVAFLFVFKKAENDNVA